MKLLPHAEFSKSWQRDRFHLLNGTFTCDSKEGLKRARSLAYNLRLVGLITKDEHSAIMGQIDRREQYLSNARPAGRRAA